MRNTFVTCTQGTQPTLIGRCSACGTYCCSRAYQSLDHLCENPPVAEFKLSDDNGRRAQRDITVSTVFTIGVYESDRQAFFQALEEARIDVLLDVRRRRAARGSRYAYANKQRLMDELARRGIAYRHVLGLAPDNATRAIQYEVDAREKRRQSQRILLAPAYVARYVNDTLDRFDFDELSSELQNARAPVLLCLERVPDACHRSLVAPRLARALGTKNVVHLIARSSDAASATR